MDCLNVWDYPELFKTYDFNEIDKMVKFIQYHRAKNDLCDKIIKELNNRIDIDFIKDSEEIEGNFVVELKNVDFDEDYEELYETNIFDKSVKNPSIDEFYLGKYRTIIKNGALTIYRKDPKSNEIKRFKCNMPTHLKALKDALLKGRKDKNLIEQGIHPPVEAKFIENLHHTLFDYYILINTRLNKNPSKPPIKPEGYGKFRRTIYINDKPHKYNVEVEGANWQPIDADFVNQEMQTLLNNYNTSKLHPILKAIIFKVCMVRIHPFRDGNGRTSRLMLNYMLVRNGYPTVTIRGNHKERYFMALDNAIENNNYDDMVAMVKEELTQRCKQYIQIINKLKTENINENNQSCNEQDDLKI